MNTEQTGRAQHMGNTRFDEQRKKMERAKELGHCTFCYEHLPEYHDAPITHESLFWVVTANDYPYHNCKNHLLLIYRYHIENIEQLPPLAWVEFGEMVCKLKGELGIEGGAVFMRFGDEDYSGGTLPHLHAHIVVPDIESPTYKPTSCWVGARPEVLATKKP